MRTLNLGILAHVDAGKTSLTERLLYAAGVIDQIGRVDDGSTQTDSLALERQRGITIKSAVVSFVIGGITVNLIDTPGHPDFIAEVERVLSVLDGAVLVISAVEGVQAQTRILLRTLQRLRIPTLIFVNKIDRGGAQYERTLAGIAEKLTPAIVPMGTTAGLGTPTATFTPALASGAAELLAEHDDAFLAAYLDNAVPDDRIRDELARQTGRASIHPVYFGSAITGAGIDALISGITELLPAGIGDAAGPLSATVFKVDRGAAGEKIAYVRVFSGSITIRDRLRFGANEGKVTSVSVFENGTAVSHVSVAAGHIGKLGGLADIQIGDVIGAPREIQIDGYFRPPTLETVVVPGHRSAKGALHAALLQLAEQDPLISLRQDDVRQEISVSLYGEVQKEVIQSTLANDYGLDVTFRETTTICAERPAGIGAAVEMLGEPGNPFLATVGLRVGPAPVGSGLQFRLDVNVRTIALYVYKEVAVFRQAMTDTVRKTLQQGLYGWQVIDCVVTMTHSGYSSPSTGSGDFRYLTPLVLMGALKRAGTVVCEPINWFRLDVPADTLGAVLPVLGALGALPQSTRESVIEGEIPASRVHQLEQQLPALTRGEGVLESAFDHYRPVRGTPPTRPRSDLNPLNRKEYLLHVVRRV